jgi:nitric oxide reductase subunit B
MKWRQIGGWIFAAGFVLLVWDLLTIGRKETRPAQSITSE